MSEVVNSEGSTVDQPPASPQWPPVGAIPPQLGRYRPQSILGVGSSAVVYWAYDPVLERDVALKVGAAGLLLQDARGIAQFHHANIVLVHDVGEHDSQFYLSMQLILGETLERRLQREPLPLREAVVLLHKIALALDHAHAKGVVHRDVKPSNILLDEHREPYLTDFGLARRVAGGEAVSRPGDILGTLDYMAPEQAQGRSHEADGRADVYSLGVILYRLLTQRLPFARTGSVADLLQRVIATPPPEEPLLAPGVPPVLRRVCLKALAKDPGERFESAAALADELWRWLNDLPSKVWPDTLPRSVARWARHSPAVAWLLTAACGLTVALIILWVRALVLSERAENDREKARLAEDRRTLEAQARAYSEALNLLDQARQRAAIPTQGRRAESQRLLDRLAGLRGRLGHELVPKIDVQRRSIEASLLGVPDLQVLGRPVILSDKGVFQPLIWRAALHPDDRSMVVGTHRGPIRWVRGEQFPLPEGLDAMQPRPRVAYSHDGQYLAFDDPGSGLQLWDERATKLLARLEQPSSGPVPPTLAIYFPRSGKAVWACRADARVRSWNLPGFTPDEGWDIRARPGETLTAAAFNAGGTWLAVGDGEGQVRLCARDGRMVVFRTDCTVEALAWSLDERLVAVGTRDGSVQLFSRAGVPSHRLVVAHAGVSHILFHPNGQWLLAGGREGGMIMFDADTGVELLRGEVTPWGISANGRVLAGSTFHSVAFAELMLPQAIHRLSSHRAGIGQLRWCADNVHLVSMDAAFQIRVWHAARGALVARFSHPPGPEYVGNASAVLSDNALLLASAGGRDAFIREVRSGKEWHWPFEREALGNRLASLGGDRFLLVREERVHVRPDGEAASAAFQALAGLLLGHQVRVNGQSVAYELQPGRQPRRLRVLRPHVPGERGFLQSGLSSDGRRYYWVGPRFPETNWRVEVYEVETGRLVRPPLARPASRGTPELSAGLSSDGRHLFVQDQGSDGGTFLHDLDRAAPPQQLVPPATASPGLRWLAQTLNAGGVSQVALRPWGAAEEWVRIGTGDGFGPSFIAFSHDGRFLAFGSQGGGVTVVDVPLLRELVR
jgi:WD40 repeat protein